MNRQKLIDLSILIVLFIAVAALPINYVVDKIYVYHAIMIGVLLLYLIFLLVYLKLNPYLINKKKNYNAKNLLLLLPSVIIIISNFIYAWCAQEKMNVSFEEHAILEALLIILIAIIEELLFRFVLLGNLDEKRPLRAILISSSIFALSHLSIFFSTFNPIDLIPIIYAFGLGMILGLFYMYSRLFIACVCFHVLFNLINDFLFENIYQISNDMWFYIINTLIGLIVGVYLLLIYLFIFRKKETN
ncbi:MAG: CPBP family intramembrane metalloprotease [Bacilli bacterium]|nr:CPBP family intramembrane metalloprotease [Bacilli bacterium]